MAELDDVKREPYTVVLGGEKRIVQLGMRAWGKIDEKWGSIEKVGEAFQKNMRETLLYLFFFSIKRKPDEEITIEQTEDWLDEYNIGELSTMATEMMESMFKSLPNAKKWSRQTVAPQDAK